MTIQLKKTRVPDMKLGIPISNSFREFVKTYKHCNVPSQHSELGRWTEEQRQLYERKQIGRSMEANLTDEQEAKLMAVGFDFARTLNIPKDDDLYSI
mmetsp:Transcript_30426/g.45931  ORF Transcript_30426/g.45931 Transcript_30426/m.45931 type:complete len:97 (-) Transcript_30426:617-907(-)